MKPANSVCGLSNPAYVSMTCSFPAAPCLHQPGEMIGERLPGRPQDRLVKFLAHGRTCRKARERAGVGDRQRGESAGQELDA